MNLDRRRMMLYAAAILTAVAWAYKLWPSSTPARPPTRPAVSTALPAGAAPPAAAAAPAPALAADQFAAWANVYRSSARDPFFTVEELAAMNRPRAAAPASQPAAPAAPPALPTHVLKLVMISGSVTLATIDDEIVKVGDRLGDERVAEILPDAVVLEHGTERRRLLLAGATATSGVILERAR